MNDILTIRETIARARADGIQISEYALRTWISNGSIPARSVGNKKLVYYPNLVKYLKCEPLDAPSEWQPPIN